MASRIRTLTIADSLALPRWRRPETLLYVMAAAMPISFATWTALLNNFVIEAAGFTGVQIGWLQSVREVPGFLAIGVIALLLVIREQLLALIALILLGVATGITALFPSFGGLLFVTLLSSIGFHYYETVNQSLQLQWIDRSRAPQTLGRIVAVGSAASLIAYLTLVLTWKTFDLSFEFVYATAGTATAAIALGCLLIYPQFESPNPQRKHMVLRRRYWLYYLMQFMAGARRQIFVVFAAFMMVERFGFRVDEITALFILNFLANMVLAPVMGRALSPFRRAAAVALRICRAGHRLPQLRGHLLFRLGRGDRGRALRHRPPVFRAGVCAEDLFPEDRRSRGHRADRRRRLHHQPYRRGLPAGAPGLCLGAFAGGGVRPCRGHRRHILRTGAPGAASSRTGQRDGVFPSRRPGACRVAMPRLLVIGASGAGTSTLGRLIANACATQHFDADDFFWHPTDPPFTRRRRPAERMALMEAVFLPRSDWVLSGSPLGWSDPIVPRLTHVVFLTLASEQRLGRLARREAARYGGRIAGVGDLAAHHRGFMDWAGGYDDPAFTGRSRAAHEAWLDRIACPLLRLVGDATPPALAEAVCDWLDHTGAGH